MNNLIFLIPFIFLSVGLFFILSEICGTPTGKTTKAVKAVLTPLKTAEDNIYLKAVDFFAVPVANIFPFPKSTLLKHQQILDSANIKLSSKLYLSRSIIKAMLLFLTTFICSFIIKPLLAMSLSVPFLVYLDESKKADKLTSNYRKSIERELPEFVATISAQLLNSRDVVRIMQDFSKNTQPNFKKELQKTVKDMESGSYELALSRFGSRVNSPILNNVIRGLDGVLKGNDEVTYFKVLEYDLKQAEISNMKKQAQKCIPKINVSIMILLVGIIFLLTGALVIDMVNGMGVIF